VACSTALLSLFALVVSSPISLEGKVISLSSTDAVVSLGKAGAELRVELWLEDLVGGQTKLEPKVIAGEYILSIAELTPESTYKLYATAIGQKSELLGFSTSKSPQQPRLPEVAFGKIEGADSYIVAQIVNNITAGSSVAKFILPNEFGNWTTDLAGYKSLEGDYFNFAKESSSLKLDVYAGGEIVASQKLNLTETTPFPDISVSDKGLVRKVEAQTNTQVTEASDSAPGAFNPENIEIPITSQQYESIFAQTVQPTLEPTAPVVKPKIVVTMNADGDILNAQATNSQLTSNVTGVANEIVANFNGYREYDVPLPPAFLGFFTNYGYSAIGTISLLNSCSRSAEVERMCGLYREFLSREAQKRGGAAITNNTQARSFGSIFGDYYSNPIFAQDFHREVVKKAGYEGIGASKSPNNIGSHGCIDIWDKNSKGWSTSRKVLIVDTARENDFMEYRGWVRKDESIYPDFKGRWGFDMPQEVGGSRGGIFRWSRSDVCGQIEVEYKIGGTTIAQTPLTKLLSNLAAEKKPATNSLSQRGYYTISSTSPISYIQKFYALAGASLTVFVDTNQNKQKDVGEQVLTQEQLGRFTLERNSDFIDLTLKTGWNLIHLPVSRPQDMKTIKSFLDEVESQGSVILHASEYSGDSTQPFVLRQDGQQYGQDFNLQIGKGLLVYFQSSAGQLLVAGDLPGETEPLALGKGLQLIGLSQAQLTGNLASASSFLDDTSAKFISRLNNESYQTLLKDETDFGTNFELNSTLGYFVLVE